MSWAKYYELASGKDEWSRLYGIDFTPDIECGRFDFFILSYGHDPSYGSLLSPIEALSPQWENHFKMASAEWVKSLIKKHNSDPEGLEENVLAEYINQHGRKPKIHYFDQENFNKQISKPKEYGL